VHVKTSIKILLLELEEPFRIARGTSSVRENVLLEVEAGGLVGRGEAAPIRRYRQDAASTRAALEQMTEALTLENLREFATFAARASLPGQRAAQAALDVALHDWRARELGIPVQQLLGLPRKPIPPTSWTIGLDPIPEALEKVKKAAGFEVLKLKMGSDFDLELLEAVRATTQQPLRVDANEGWDLAGAMYRLPVLERCGVEFIEQPLPAGCLEETATLRRASRIPILADEDVHVASDIPKLLGAYDGINVKLAKCGGIQPALELIHTARAHGMKILLGCMIESSLGIAAALVLAPLVDWLDLDGSLLLRRDPFQGLRCVHGRFSMPEGPGLGVEPANGATRTAPPSTPEVLPSS
jgi:L-alanine-DL-glutamate epimerase-like enolase superfamily enzyme